MIFHENMIFCNLLKLQSVKLKRQHALVDDFVFFTLKPMTDGEWGDGNKMR